MKRIKFSKFIFSAITMVLIPLSSSFAKKAEFASSERFCKQQDLPGALTGMAASRDGQHFVAIASDEGDPGWSCYSSEIDPISNMSHGWKKRATFIGAAFYGITFEADHFIITGKKDYKVPMIVISKDNGINWREEKPIINDFNGVGSDDSNDSQFSYDEVNEFAYSNGSMTFVTIGSDDVNTVSSFFLFSLKQDEISLKQGENYTDFVAIASEDFTPDAFASVGSDDNASSWYDYWNFKSQQSNKKHAHFRTHKNGATYWYVN